MADLAHLETLPRRELVSGLSEVVKVALACDEALWRDLEASAERLVTGDLATLAPIVHRAIERKARVVRDDEHEAGSRKLLNLGHTVGHALEAAGGFARHRHGEAVAIGLVVECALAQQLGVARDGLVERVRTLLARLRLPTDASPGELAAAWPFVAHDKKRLGGSVSLPLPLRVGEASVVSVALGDIARTMCAESAG